MAERGRDITVSAGGNVVAKALDCTWDQAIRMVPLHGMDDDDDIFEPGGQGWTMTISKLWVPAETAHSLLQAAVSGRTSLAIVWLDSDGFGKSGTAYISGWSDTWSSDNPVVTNITLQGTDSITYTPAGS